LEVAPKELFGALGGVVMAASSRRQEAQPQLFAPPRLVQIAPQGIAHQSRNRELFSLSQKAQLTLRGFFEEEGCSFHMTYDIISTSSTSTSSAGIRPTNFSG